MRLLGTATPRGRRAWWARRATFALRDTRCAKRSERQHPYSKKHKHLLHSCTSFLIQPLKTNLAASVRSKFPTLLNAILLEANTAASVLSKFQALPEAISVPANALVAPCIREMAQKSFDEGSGLITESIVNPFTLLASACDSCVAEQRQMSRKRGLRGFERVAQFTDAQLALAQRGDHAQSSGIGESFRE